ncbi:MAG: hypothetical protein KBE65_15945 [Phycisphaerae bacterium]|nr:hypothetical protein [Phycisphaerae bacterium]
MGSFRVAGIALAVAVVGSLIAGCATEGGTHSLSTQIGTRALSLTATGSGEFSLDVNPPSDHGVVMLNKHKIVIQGDSVLLHGKEVMKLAPESKRVDIAYEAGRVTISDGINPARTLHL